MKQLLLLAGLGTILFAGCQKDNRATSPINSTQSSTKTEKLNDVGTLKTFMAQKMHVDENKISYDPMTQKFKVFGVDQVSYEHLNHLYNNPISLSPIKNK